MTRGLELLRTGLMTGLHTSLRWAAVAALAGTLASCGGGEASSDSTVTAQQLRQQDAVVDAALCSSGEAGYTLVHDQCLRSSSLLASRLAQARQLAGVVPFTASTLMDWAQSSFPALFPGSPADQAGNGFIYRFYPQTQTFLAVAGDAVYVLGPVTGNQLLYVGSMSGFNCSANPSTCAVNNVAALTVDAGPSGSDVNILYTDVTICMPGSTTQCQTIDHIIVDTGSSGLRVLAGVLSPALAGLPLTPASSTQSLMNCAQFVDGSFLWGPVVTADVSMAGEKATSVPIQVVGDSRFGSAPRACSSGSTATNTPESFGANGIIGLSVFKEDCGPGCVSLTNNGFYYACSGVACVNSRAALAQQLKNPVAQFPKDNNGVIIILPSAAQNGAVSISGSMLFGIGTQGNNQMGSEAVLTLGQLGRLHHGAGRQDHAQQLPRLGLQRHLLRPRWPGGLLQQQPGARLLLPHRPADTAGHQHRHERRQQQRQLHGGQRGFAGAQFPVCGVPHPGRPHGGQHGHGLGPALLLRPARDHRHRVAKHPQGHRPLGGVLVGGLRSAARAAHAGWPRLRARPVRQSP